MPCLEIVPSSKKTRIVEEAGQLIGFNGV